MRLIILTVVLFASCATARASLSEKSLNGTWECGPTIMQGPNFELVVTTRTTNNADHTYSNLTMSVITPHGGAAVTNKDIAYGSWHLGMV